ncbi:E3 ubiquitin-protein ligase ubr1 [Taxawa tesnikishii (nom. ined.)]|nr:E3 ubiquitin-protein ligase ubr1 [Dothideales sp. JES 119]
MSQAERNLSAFLRDLPHEYENRFTEEADEVLRRYLFRSLAGHDEANLRLFFPQGIPEDPTEPWSLRQAQGAVDGAEYTEAARGHPCGHIFRDGESTYRCKTCAADDTCVLCARCFESSDHDGHTVFISVSPGNSGCCDCADDEAWIRPVRCSIHSTNGAVEDKNAGKAPALPEEIVEVIRMTIGRVLDYMVDVFSCSPEQLRLPKTEASVRFDELKARLIPNRYEGQEHLDADEEYALILWNDEKHTVEDVQNQVAKACAQSKRFGLRKAMEVNDIGRSVVHTSTNLNELLRMTKVIEELKVTVTIRSARDTFREQMCGTIIDWISDISGCSVGPDPHILRDTICEELLKPWQKGSEGINSGIGKAGIDDHEYEENVKQRQEYQQLLRPFGPGNVVRVELELDEGDEGDDDEDDEEIIMDEEIEEMQMDDDTMDVDAGEARELERIARNIETDMDMLDESEDTTEALEATMAGYPPPPPPPAVRRTGADHNNLPTARRVLSPNDSDDGEGSSAQQPVPFSNVPKTPKTSTRTPRQSWPLRHWLDAPEEFMSRKSVPPAEDLWKRLRLDYLILFDLRLWKTLRINLRHLYISTVVTVPHFKRILGLRFAGLYTLLSQLYLIADREPDHSIINLSVQMLTTPSITAEVVERGNFLTNLLAILWISSSVNPKATLAFDAGAVTNRRMFHFFHDTKYMFQSGFVQEKVRNESRYLLQFLDLVKLHQGICPNVRAVGEHVEYEADAWISASMIIKEINKLCRQVGEAFCLAPGEELEPTCRAIRTTALVTLNNSFGVDRKRFIAAEIKKDATFHDVHKFYGHPERVSEFAVLKEPMSFHHPLHYLLSWLLEAGRNMHVDDIRQLLHFEAADLKEVSTGSQYPTVVPRPTSDELLSLLFDHPLRVCVWLSQMRAGMWVRNGITLRHQMLTYRGTSQRDIAYQRDIFMLQAGMVLCKSPEDPQRSKLLGHSPKEPLNSKFLAQMIDRYDMQSFIGGSYAVPDGYDQDQRMDVMEDFFHMLIVILGERTILLPASHDPEQHIRSLQREIAHVLCFKPLSFSDIEARLTDRVGDAEEFDEVLEGMTTFRAPEGLSDSGTFELKPEYIEMIDPYYAYYNRNQREEAENIYKAYIAKKTGIAETDVVFQPRLPLIKFGLFEDLAGFTRTSLFDLTIYAALNFALESVRDSQGKVPATRLETFLQVVLHLALVAVQEDPGALAVGRSTFISLATGRQSIKHDGSVASTFSLLDEILKTEQFAACEKKVTLIMKRMEQKQPDVLQKARERMGLTMSRDETQSPAPVSAEDRERKKKQALERQARVMAQFKQQQTSFMANQGLDWDLDDEEANEQEDGTGAAEAITRKTWQYPSGSCMLCQEETDDDRLYGTFAFITQSRIIRQTPRNDEDFVAEVYNTPSSLDRSADGIRPFGKANERTPPDQDALLSGDREYITKTVFRSLATIVADVPSNPSPSISSPSSISRESSWASAHLPAFLRRTDEPREPTHLADTAHGTQSYAPHADLLRAYHRIKESLAKNGITSGRYYNNTTISADQACVEAMYDSVGVSISAIEIAYRGVGSMSAAGGAGTLLNVIPDQTLTHLRILAETAVSYAAVTHVRNPENSGLRASTPHSLSWRKKEDLLWGIPYTDEEDAMRSRALGIQRSLFEEDLFVLLQASRSALRIRMNS